MRVEEIIPNTGTSRRKRKMMPWMWGLVGVVCAMVVYCGGVMAYATDWTLVFTEDELVEVGGMWYLSRNLSISSKFSSFVEYSLL